MALRRQIAGLKLDRGTERVRWRMKSLGDRISYSRPFLYLYALGGV